MAIDYYDAGNGDGMFQILGRIFYVAEVLDTVRVTTVQEEALDIIEQYKNKTDTNLLFDAAMAGIPRLDQAWRATGNSYLAGLAAVAQQLIIEFAAGDNPRLRRTLADAIEYIVDDMETRGFYVDSSVVSSGVTPGVSNSTNDLSIQVALQDDRGFTLQNVLAESLELEIIQHTTTRRARLTSEQAVNAFSELWPAGSGLRQELATITAADNRVTNGTFELDTAEAGQPDGWIILEESGFVSLTDVAVLSLEISSSPTSGTYYLEFTDPVTSVVSATPPLQHDASGSDVQAALRTIAGLGSVTVETSGTSPNLTHVITFIGIAGDLSSSLAVTEDFDTGSAAVSATTDGDAESFRGRSLTLATSSSEEPVLVQSIALTAGTPYWLFYRARKSAGSTASDGVTISLIDSIGGTAIADEAGNNIELEFQLADLTTSWQATALAFSLPPSQSLPVYIQITRAFNATSAIHVDDVMIVPAARLYEGGPLLGLFEGAQNPVTGDNWDITISNNYAGTLQHRADQMLNMKRLGKQFPIAGSTNIPDSVVA